MRAAGRLGRPVEQYGGEHEALLGAVMQIAREPSPGLVRGRDDARPRSVDLNEAETSVVLVERRSVVGGGRQQVGERRARPGVGSAGVTIGRELLLRVRGVELMEAPMNSQRRCARRLAVASAKSPALEESLAQSHKASVICSPSHSRYEVTADLHIGQMPTIRAQIPYEQSQQAGLRALGDAGVRKLVDRYIDAWERGDVYAIAALLAEDATFAMPPCASWWRGRTVIAAFAAEAVHRYLPARANGQLANAAYRWNPKERRYIGEALKVLTIEGSQVKEMTAFMTPKVFPRFGLPGALPH